MSLQIRIKDTVGEWLAVPQKQRKNVIIPPTLINPHF